MQNLTIKAKPKPKFWLFIYFFFAVLKITITVTVHHPWRQSARGEVQKPENVSAAFIKIALKAVVFKIIIIVWLCPHFIHIWWFEPILEFQACVPTVQTGSVFQPFPLQTENELTEDENQIKSIKLNITSLYFPREHSQWSVQQSVRYLLNKKPWSNTYSDGLDKRPRVLSVIFMSAMQR